MQPTKERSPLRGSAAISISAPVSASLPSRAPRSALPRGYACARDCIRDAVARERLHYSLIEIPRERENVAPTRMHAHVIHSLPSAHVCVAFCMRVRRYTWPLARTEERKRGVYISRVWRVCALSQLITTHVATTQARAFPRAVPRRHRESAFCRKRRRSVAG